MSLHVWMAALVAVLFAVNLTAPGTRLGVTDSSALLANATGPSADHSGQPDRIGQVIDGGAFGIRLIEIRLAPERVAERRSDLGMDCAARDFGLGADNPRLVSESASGGFDCEGIPPLYHLHAALLI